jgi:CelD/BcsL family acetyltransferase involved in cellulose biosynthesis
VISVRIGPPDPALSDAFEALARRAAPNVFMHPAALAAATARSFARVRVLEAWHGENAARTLVGLWALGEQRVARFWPRLLVAPPYDYAFVGGPVVDPDHADAVLPAFFDAIAGDPALPKIIKLKLIDGDAATFAPMMRALQARRGQMLRLAEHPRPFLGQEGDRKRSGSTAKKLRQDWNRLSALGHADVTNERGRDHVRAAFEIFLELELKSWKGRSGTALLCDEDDADFARRLILDLAGRGAASVALLRVDACPIAAQVLLYCGGMAYTWKTAFNAEFAKFSPGALLVDKVSDALLASGVTQIESCALEESFMAQLWTGRRATVDLLVDVGAADSLRFALVHLGERAYAAARERRRWLQEQTQLRHKGWFPARRKNLAVTRG